MINHHYFTHANSFVGIHNDRVPADTWAKLQGHLKSPPNNVQASVAEDGRAKQNYVQCGEHFPAHVYPRMTATCICAYNKNVQQPSTKKNHNILLSKEKGLTHNQIIALVQHALDPDDSSFFCHSGHNQDGVWKISRCSALLSEKENL